MSQRADSSGLAALARRNDNAFGARAEAKATARSKAADEASASLGEKLTPKQLGEIGEAEFIAKAVGMAFVVGDSESYDFIVNPRKTFIYAAVVAGRNKGQPWKHD